MQIFSYQKSRRDYVKMKFHVLLKFYNEEVSTSQEKLIILLFKLSALPNTAKSTPQKNFNVWLTRSRKRK